MDFRSIRIITDDIKRLVSFYEKATGLQADWSTDDFAELKTTCATLAARYLSQVSAISRA